MFHDLNVPWPAREGTVTTTKKSKKGSQKADDMAPSTSDSIDPLSLLTESDKLRMSQLGYELRDCMLLVGFLQTVGYSTMAWNHVVHTKYDPQMHPHPFCPTRSHPHPPFPKLDPRTRGSHGVKTSGHGIKQLSRLTLVLDKDQAIKAGTGFVAANSNALQQYDLLAVMPLTENGFQHACITMSELKPFSVDIITLDLAAAPRLPFHLKRSTVGAALANGVVFEITYGSATDAKACTTSNQDLAASRRNLFSGAREILRVTNGKGVIISSAAMDVLGLRAPYDVLNMYV